MNTERDLAHEANMRALQREQLRGEDFEPSEREAYWEAQDALYWDDVDYYEPLGEHDYE